MPRSNALHKVGVAQKFLDAFQKEKIEDIHFISSLSASEREELISYFSSLGHEYIQANNGRRKATIKQQQLYLHAALLLSHKEFQQMPYRFELFDPEVVDPVLAMYCPPWFNDFMNKDQWAGWNLSYNRIMNMADKGYLVPGRDLLTLIVPKAIVEWDFRNMKRHYRPENLTKRKITLQEHIWVIFEEVNSIAYTFQSRNSFEETLPEGDPWMVCLRDVSLSGDVDRKRLLNEAILAGSRNFNKIQSGWFADLFETLNPTKAELLLMQKELMQALSSSHSKVVNTSLNAVKEIIDSPDFDVELFQSNCGLLLSSETKSIVSTALSLIDKLARIHKERTRDLCIIASQALIHNDESIQTKTAKLILKHFRKPGKEIEEAVNQYYEAMLVSTKALFKDWITTIGEETTTLQRAAVDYTPRNPKIDAIDTIDKLIFFSSQAFENHKPWHIDLLPAAMLALRDDLKGEHIGKLEPALQRAYKRVTEYLTSSTGYLDDLLAAFFIEVTGVLATQHPLESRELRKHHEYYHQQNEARKRQVGPDAILIIRDTSNWKPYVTDDYSTHQSILVAAAKLFSSGDKLPLLSTPTHEPALVDAVALIERLHKYQSANKTPDNVDFQVAVSRCWINDRDSTLAAASKLLQGEYQRLFEFITGKTALPRGPFTIPSVWMVAGTRVSPPTIYHEFSDFDYAKMPHSYFNGRFKWEVINNELSVVVDKDFSRETNAVKNFWSKIVSTNKEHQKIIYDLDIFKAQHVSYEHNDLDRHLCLFPFNPEPLLGRILARYGASTSGAPAQNSKIITRAIARLNEFNFSFGEMAHVFVAVCMLNDDKTIQTFAAECWAKGVANNTIDSEELGDTLGVCEGKELAPLKRFTDLASSHMMNISADHNLALERLVENLLLRLPAEPIKNLKRLLELLLELQTANQSQGNDELKAKFKEWNSSSTLKNVISALK